MVCCCSRPTFRLSMSWDWLSLPTVHATSAIAVKWLACVAVSGTIAWAAALLTTLPLIPPGPL